MASDVRLRSGMMVAEVTTRKGVEFICVVRPVNPAGTRLHGISVADEMTRNGDPLMEVVGKGKFCVCPTVKD